MTDGGSDRTEDLAADAPRIAEDVGEVDDEPALIQAVVLDANIHRGNFTAESVEGLALRLAVHGIQLWIPQQVIWEWSAHAVDQAKEIRVNMRRLAATGLPGLAKASEALPEDPIQVAEAITAHLDRMPNVARVPPYGESAIEGLRDQILAIGAGTRKTFGTGEKKQHVRTGASDSAMTRDAVRHIDPGNADKLVFLTANRKDFQPTLDELDLTDKVRIFPNEPTLFEVVSRLTPAPKYVQQILHAHFSSAATDLDSDLHGASESWVTELVSDIDISRIYERASGMDTVTSVDANPYAMLVSIADIVVDSELGTEEEEETAGASYASFLLTLDTDLTVVGYSIDVDGQIDPANDFLDAILKVPCVATIVGRKVVAVRQVDQAVAMESEPRFVDDNDALRWLVEAVEAATDTTATESSSIQGLELFEFKDATGRVIEIMDVNTAPIGDDSIAWMALFRNIGGVLVRCRHDAAARVWAGPDSFDAQPPYWFDERPYSLIAEIWRSAQGASQG
ncbi:hypothetical protein CH263_08340 [Rhodococcus sp. 06-1059B-a]|nr:hypothetical protein [Rhodococcus sp. 06-1059B-a]OZD68898.1 hypothetical protein CH263_08340 [Rhodococcus sp. 06-1059B-a]